MMRAKPTRAETGMGMRVLVVAGDGLIFDEFGELVTARAIAAPPPAVWDLSVVLELARFAFVDRPGVVVLTGEAMAELGIDPVVPSRLGVDRMFENHPVLEAPRARGWNVSGLGPWSLFWSDNAATARVSVACFPWLSSRTGPLWVQDIAVREFAADLARYQELTGSPFYATPGVSGLALMRDVTRLAAAPKWVAPPKISMEGLRHAEDDYRLWEQPGNADGTFEHTYDANGMYLGAAGAVYLPVSELAFVRGGWFDAKRAGYWQIVRPVWNDPNMPHPCGNHQSGSGLIWVTTPTMSLLAELASAGLLEMPDVVASWTAASSRVLRQWQSRLSGALGSLAEFDGPQMRRAIKATYAEAIGLLGREGGRVWRPDWRHHVIAAARCNLFRRVWSVGMATGRWPVRLRVDAVTYTSDEYDPVAAVPCGEAANGQTVCLPLGRGLGTFRPLGGIPARVAQRKLTKSVNG